jgi:protein-tyrosine phosphatase
MWSVTITFPMAAKKSVLFVCLGNICRSPACEGICRSIAKGAVTVESAGSIGFHIGESPDRRSQNACKEIGVDISAQRAQQIKKADWTRFSVIAALDQSVFRDIERARPSNATAKLVLFNAPDGVPDPYYGDFEGFRRMVAVIQRVMPQFLSENGLQ